MPMLGKRSEQPISRILSPIRVTPNRATIIHLWMPVARHLLRPTRELGRATLKSSPIWSCTGWGLPSFPGHPENWCALTAPFHPYPAPDRIVLVPGGILSVALSFASPRLHVMKHPALRCSDFPPDQRVLIQRSFVLLRPFAMIFPINNPLTAGTIFQAVAMLELNVHLGRNIQITPLTDGIFNFRNSHGI